MTGRAFVLLLIAASTLFAARNVGIGWLYALGYTLAAGVAASAAMGAWAVRGVRASLAPGRKTEAGVPLSVAVTLENRGSLTRRYLCVLAGPLGIGARLWPWRRSLLPEDWGSVLIPELRPGERLTVRLPVPAPRRGLHGLSRVYLQAAPLGLVAWFRSCPPSPICPPSTGKPPSTCPPFDGGTGEAEGGVTAPRFLNRALRYAFGVDRSAPEQSSERILVHPRIHPLEGLPWLASRRGHGDEDAAQRPKAGGELIKTVRPYRSGDAMRQVHWKTTARTGQLAVRETEGEDAPQQLAIVLDASPDHSADSLDLAVEIAASILSEAHRLGLEARLSSQEGGPSAQTLEAQLDWLATVKEPGSSDTPPSPPPSRGGNRGESPRQGGTRAVRPPDLGQTSAVCTPAGYTVLITPAETTPTGLADVVIRTPPEASPWPARPGEFVCPPGSDVPRILGAPGASRRAPETQP